MTSDAGDSPNGETTYSPKPPLWQPAHPQKEPSQSALLFTSLAVVAILVVIAVGGESTFLSTPSAPVEVSVLRVDGVDPPNDAPAYYRYSVQLPDGAVARYTSPDVHRVGDKVVVMRSRGRLTGRIQLTRPRVVRASPGT